MLQTGRPGVVLVAYCVLVTGPHGPAPCVITRRQRPAIFEPGALRSCPLRPQREASAEPSNAAVRVQIRRRPSPSHD